MINLLITRAIFRFFVVAPIILTTRRWAYLSVGGGRLLGRELSEKEGIIITAEAQRTQRKKNEERGSVFEG